MRLQAQLARAPERLRGCDDEHEFEKAFGTKDGGVDVGWRTMTRRRLRGGPVLMSTSVASVMAAALGTPGCGKPPCEETLTCPRPRQSGGNAGDPAAGNAGKSTVAGGGNSAPGGGGGNGAVGGGGASNGQGGTPSAGGSPSAGGRPSADGGSGGSSAQAGGDNGGAADDAGAGNISPGGCGPSNCAGCCTSAGKCVTDVTQQACGSQGEACDKCPADQQCVSGACECPGTTELCDDTCIDLSASKDNCGTCGKACEGYQFCDGGKCLPHYVSTRVQPVTSGSDPGAVAAAGVFTDGTRDDLLLQLNGDLVLSAPGAFTTAELHGPGFARYTPDGALVWGRSNAALLGDQAASPSAVAIMVNGDFDVGYTQYDPPSGPVAGTYAFRVARVDGHEGNLVWAAKFPWNTSSSGRIGLLATLSARQRVISFTPALTSTLGGTVCETMDLGNSGEVTCPASTNYLMGATEGADGSTLWAWGAYGIDGAAALNPWSAQTWQLTENPGQLPGGDGYLLGAREDGTTVGPWFTEGDSGVLMTLLVDSAGALIVTAFATGFVSFNGGQDLLPSGGAVLAKINPVNGHIVWRTPVASMPYSIFLAPDDRIVTITRPGGDEPNTLSVYAGSDGSFLSSFSGPGIATYGAIASGKTEMYLAGPVSTASDFDPGAETDVLGTTPGVFVSRFSFE